MGTSGDPGPGSHTLALTGLHQIVQTICPKLGIDDINPHSIRSGIMGYIAHRCAYTHTYRGHGYIDTSSYNMALNTSAIYPTYGGAVLHTKIIAKIQDLRLVVFEYYL